MSAPALIRDFRLIDADESRVDALATLEASTATWVIVRRDIGAGRPPLFYVFERRFAVDAIRDGEGRRVGTALDFPHNSPCPTLARVPVSAVDARRIVLSEHGPVGFVDAPAVSRGASALWGEPAAFRSAKRFNRGDLSQDDEGAPREVVRELSAAWPDSVQAGAIFALLVSLDSLGIGAKSTTLQVALGARIDIVVRPLRGVRLVGPETQTLVVSAPQPDAPAFFQVQAGESGEGAVRVYAFCAGRSLAALDLSLTITEDGQPLQPAPRTRVAATIPATPRMAPDLSLLVTETDTEIRFRLQTRDGDGRSYSPIRTEINSREYFAGFSADIEKLAVDKPEEQDVAKRTIELRGADLFDKLLPAELQKDLWEVRDRIGTMQITSDEAWIPWEVCRFIGRSAEGGNIEGPFFAEAFSVTRWLHGTAAPAAFGFANWGLVVPSDSGLPLAEREREYIESLDAPGRKVTRIAARFAALTKAMESERYNAWHFCGHAHAGSNANADKAAIELENRESLTVDLFSGKVENALGTRPFVFLNACQSARGGRSLTGVGGWARRFIRPTYERRAASVFIGSYWSVYDAAAQAFTPALYSRILAGGQPIGQAVREARAAIRTPDDPLTWLAYTVYADPLAIAA